MVQTVGLFIGSKKVINRSKLLGLLISCFFLFLALRGIDFSLVQKSLKKIDETYFFLSYISLFGSYISRSFLWKTLVGMSSYVTIGQSFKSILIGNMGNCILPARLGDLLRVHAINKYTPIGKSFALGTLVVERVFDVIILIQFVFISAFIVPIPTYMYDGIEVVVYITVFAVALFVIGYFMMDFKLKERFFLVFSNLPFVKKIDVKQSWDMFKNGICSIQTIRRFFVLYSLSAITWIGVLLYIYFMLLAFSFDVSLNVAFLIVTVLNLGVLFIPTPGNIGVYQFLCIVSLSYFGIDRNSALSYSFVLHAVDYIPTVFLGIICSISLNIRISGIKRNPEEKGNL